MNKQVCPKPICFYSCKTIEGFRLRIHPNDCCLYDWNGKQVLVLPIMDIKKITRKATINSTSHRITIDTFNNRKYYFTFDKTTTDSQTIYQLLKYQKKQINIPHHKPLELPSYSWIIPFSELQIHDTIGIGCGGKVKKVRWCGQYYAAKIIPRINCEEDRRIFRKEIDCLIALRHPSCIQFHGVSFDDNDIPHLIMEYCEKGSLHDILEEKDERLCSWLYILSILYDIARGLRFMHSCGIIHRDIKPANIMISSWNYRLERDESMIRIVDYGISRILEKRKEKQEFATTLCGSTGYMAPEVFNQQYSFMSDVFGFGVLMYLLIFKETPFPMKSAWNYEKILNEKKPLELPSQIPKLISSLLLSCLQYESNLRPDFEIICFKLQEILVPLLKNTK